MRASPTVAMSNSEASKLEPPLEERWLALLRTEDPDVDKEACGVKGFYNQRYI